MSRLHSAENARSGGSVLGDPSRIETAVGGARRTSYTNAPERGARDDGVAVWWRLVAFAIAAIIVRLALGGYPAHGADRWWVVFAGAIAGVAIAERLETFNGRHGAIAAVASALFGALMFRGLLVPAGEGVATAAASFAWDGLFVGFAALYYFRAFHAQSDVPDTTSDEPRIERIHGPMSLVARLRAHRVSDEAGVERERHFAVAIAAIIVWLALGEFLRYLGDGYLAAGANPWAGLAGAIGGVVIAERLGLFNGRRGGGVAVGGALAGALIMKIAVGVFFDSAEGLSAAVGSFVWDGPFVGFAAHRYFLARSLNAEVRRPTGQIFLRGRLLVLLFGLAIIAPWRI